jgi:hypothetical protein
MEMEGLQNDLTEIAKNVLSWKKLQTIKNFYEAVAKDQNN